MLSDVIITGGVSVKDAVVANGDGSVSYTFDNVTSNQTITVSFEKTVYTITTIVDEGAEINAVYESHKCDLCEGYDHEY